MADPVITAALRFLSDILPDAVDAATPSQEAIEALLNTWKQFVFGATGTVYNEAKLQAWKTDLEAANALTDAMERKLFILDKVQNDRMFGIFVLLLVIPDRVANGSKRWWSMLGAEQLADGNLHLPFTGHDDDGETWQIKQLPKPSSTQKYLILSDIHRDSAGDDKGLFQTGSIDHFKANKDLYLKVLNYAEANGYTVIEGGDCEELWFVGQTYPRTSGKLDPKKKLQEAISTHSDVYDKLAAMHKSGKYIRVQGNHDSYVKAPTVFAELKTKMEQNAAPTFQIYDACIIDGVKTMMEHSALDLVMDEFAVLTGNNTQAKQTKGAEIARTLLQGRLGLTAQHYTETTRMIICHGHQFDFWNNPDNEIIGIVISNTVGVPVDEMMDPLLDIGGIALEGNPFLNFGSLFASLPIFNSWISKQPAEKFAHKIKHQANSSRLLSDGVMFCETIPTLWSAFGLFLNHTDTNGTVTTPAASRTELGLTDLTTLTAANVKTYFERHAFNHICLGHTHGPHSQPYFSIKNIGAIAPPLAPVTSAIEAVIPSILSPQLKTGYFNSGTAGWMEGLIWAIDIDDTGQARLVYFLEDCDTPISVSCDASNSGQEFKSQPKPHYMDWELEPLRGAATITTPIAEQALEQFIGDNFDATGKTVMEIYDKLAERIGAITGKADLFKDWMQEKISLPMDIIGLALMMPADAIQKIRNYDLKELQKDAADGVEKAGEVIRKELEEQLDQLRLFGTDVLMSVKRRSLFGFADWSEKETISIKVPYATANGPSADKATIDELAKFFAPSLSGLTSDYNQKEPAAKHLAAFAYSIIGDFPNNMPFFSTMDEVNDPAVRARRTKTPVLQAFLSTLWMYPLHGRPVVIDNCEIETVLTIDKGFVELKVELSAPPLVGFV